MYRHWNSTATRQVIYAMHQERRIQSILTWLLFLGETGVVDFLSGRYTNIHSGPVGGVNAPIWREKKKRELCVTFVVPGNSSRVRPLASCAKELQARGRLNVSISAATSLCPISYWITRINMFAVRNALRLGSRLSIPAVARRGCAGAAISVDDVVNGLTDDQIQVSHTG